MTVNKDIFDTWNENKQFVNNRNDIDQFYVKPKRNSICKVVNKYLI